jgi:N-acetylglucosaminyl-diphospho-decaprenol L-rhamnosyltransferase
MLQHLIKKAKHYYRIAFEGGRRQTGLQMKETTVQADAAEWSRGKPLRNSSAALSIIIVTYNSADVLQSLLDSLPAGLDGVANFETIVVDNDSRDNSVDIAVHHPIGARVIRMGRNAGYAAAINAAAATVSKDANLLVLNPDIRLQPGAAATLVDRLSDPTIGISVPKLLDESGTTNWSIRREPSILTTWTDAVLGGTLAARLGTGEMVGDPSAYEQESPIDWATGAIVAISARARHNIGEWDESFFLYMEEVDYMRRARECGLTVLFVPQAKAVHIGGEYSENPRLSALLSANRIRYHRRHHSYLSTLAFRLSVIVGEGMRALVGPGGHKAALLAAIAPRTVPAEYRQASCGQTGSPLANRPSPAIETKSHQG